MRSRIIYPNGDESPIYDSKITLSRLQDIVGGFVDMLNIEGGVLVFNADDGDLLYNEKASLLIPQTNEKTPERMFLSGTVVLCNVGQIELD